MKAQSGKGTKAEGKNCLNQDFQDFRMNAINKDFYNKFFNH